MNDPIADMLTRIRNGVLVKKRTVTVPYSRVKQEIAKILEREGFIAQFERLESADDKQGMLRLELKYREGRSVIKGITRVSRPSRKVYRGYQEINKRLPSLGVQIISTSRGLKTNAEARDAKSGGEILCEIY